LVNDWTRHIKWPTKIRRLFPNEVPDINNRQIFSVNFCPDSVEVLIVIFPVPDDVPQDWREMNAPSLDLKFRFSEAKLKEFNQQVLDVPSKFDLSFENGSFFCKDQAGEIFLKLNYVDVTADITPNIKFA
jgi:hypothetical protein